MAKSKLIINSISYDLNIMTLDIISKPNLIEKNLIPDPTLLTENSSIVFSINNDRKELNISSYCDDATRLIFKSAFETGLKIYPTIYQPQGSINLTPNSYYYITFFDTQYRLGSDIVWYSMNLKYGGIA